MMCCDSRSQAAALAALAAAITLVMLPGCGRSPSIEARQPTSTPPVQLGAKPPAAEVALAEEKVELSATLSHGVTLRRLTLTEYINTIRDLLHVEFPPGKGPQRLIPPDGAVNGFDKLAVDVPVDSSRLEEYVDAACLVAEHAVLVGNVARPPTPTEHHRFEFEETPVHPYEITTRPWTIMRNDGLVIMQGAAGSKQGLRHSQGGKLAPIAGRYRVRVRAGARAGSDGKPVRMQIWRGGVGRTLLECEVDSTIQNPALYETTQWLEPEGDDGLNVLIVGGVQFSVANELAHQMQAEVQRGLSLGNGRQSGRLRAQMRAEGAVWMNRPNPDTRETDELPRLFLDYIEIEGPWYDHWPPRSHTNVLFEGPEAVTDLGYARRIFARLLPKAYRRPVDDEEVELIVDVVAAEIAAGESFEASIRAGLATVLCSPSFLYLGEWSDPAGNDSGRLDNHQLAERLSYFLWSSMPDETLLRVAADGQLRDRDMLLKQADRMLADPRSDALAADFAAQWLKVAEFDRFAPDRELYPRFYQPEFTGLDDDLEAQPLHFIRELLRSDESVLAVLDSNWTMANERLARYYELPPIEGEDFRRVVLPPDSPRGGLLGMAGVHRRGSDGNRTKPVERGVYVLEVLLNTPPEPPPPNVGEIAPNVEGTALSVRERLVSHRRQSECAVCHDEIDPYGLALENFNAIGLWRDVQDGEIRNWYARGGPPSIDVAGVLPGGRRFSHFEQFKRVLFEEPDAFRRALAEKLTEYALGRQLQPSDRTTIDEIVSEARDQGDSFRAFVRAVIASREFREHSPRDAVGRRRQQFPVPTDTQGAAE